MALRRVIGHKTCCKSQNCGALPQVVSYFCIFAEAYRKMISNLTFRLIMGMGPTEIIVVLVIVLLLFGGKKIPELMKGLGQGVKEFKDASKSEDAKGGESDKK